MLGLAKNAELVVVRNTNRDPADVFNHIHERYLASLVEVLDDVLEKYPGNKGKVVINMSFGWLNTEENDFIHPAHWDIFCKCQWPPCALAQGSFALSTDLVR